MFYRYHLAIILPICSIVNIVVGCVGFHSAYPLFYLLSLVTIPIILYAWNVAEFMNDMHMNEHRFYFKNDYYDTEPTDFFVAFVKVMAYLVYLVPFAINFFVAIAMMK